MMSRIVATGVVAAVFAGAMVIACGGSGSPKKQPDAKVYQDAPKVFMDAPAGSAQMGIGQACMPGSGGGLNQGDCPSGYTCLSLQSGNGPWCSKTCTAGSGDMCSQGYTGVGVASCIYAI